MMEILGEKIVIEFKYDNREEAEEHEKAMIQQGWKKEAIGHLYISNFRSYSKYK